MNNLPKAVIFIDAISSYELANYIDELSGNADIVRKGNTMNIYY